MKDYLQPPRTYSTTRWTTRHGKVSMILLWALGVPIPILLVIFLFRGCAS